MRISAFFISLSFLILFIGCHSNQTTRANNTPSTRQSVYEDVGSPGTIQGVGIESQDIAGMTDRMVRDMLSNRSLAGRSVAPRVIIDDKYFVNESSNNINKRMITERLMINLNRAASGRMVFIERAAAAMVEDERTLKREGIVSEGTMGRTATPAGADFRLSGRIMSLDTRQSSTDRIARFHEIAFKLIDLETSVVVWSGMYEFKKSARDNIRYR